MPEAGVGVVDEEICAPRLVQHADVVAAAPGSRRGAVVAELPQGGGDPHRQGAVVPADSRRGFVVELVPDHHGAPGAARLDALQAEGDDPVGSVGGGIDLFQGVGSEEEGAASQHRGAGVGAVVAPGDPVAVGGQALKG